VRVGLVKLRKEEVEGEREGRRDQRARGETERQRET